jgi:hypothetical protein
MKILKPLALAATLIATLAPAKAEHKVGDIISLSNPLGQNSLMACTSAHDTYDGWRYVTSWTRGIPLSETAAFFRLAAQAKQQWIDKVGDLHQRGRYCLMLNVEKTDYQIVAKKYISNDGSFAPSDTPPTVRFYNPYEYFCIKRKESNDDCVYALLGVKFQDEPANGFYKRPVSPSDAHFIARVLRPEILETIERSPAESQRFADCANEQGVTGDDVAAITNTGRRDPRVMGCISKITRR